MLRMPFCLDCPFVHQGTEGFFDDRFFMDTQSPMMVQSSAKQPRFFKELRAWCWNEGTLWRSMLFVFMLYVALGHLFDPDFISLFYWFNFGIHEVGHVFTRPILPHTLYVAAGTVAQLGLPIASVFLFRKQNELFGAYPFCGLWMATNLYYTAWYLGDASKQQIPMAPIFGEPTTSDWTYLLGNMGILHWDTQIAATIYCVAYILTWASIALGAWMIWQMWKKPAVNLSRND